MTNKNVNENDDMCSYTIIHDEIVSKVRKGMVQGELLLEMGKFFQVFSDATRLKILNALLLSEMCVDDISTLLNMNQSAISHQLKILCQSRLIKYRKEGKVDFYSLNDKHIEEIFSKGLEHIKEEEK